ncbi:MAG: ATP-binding protein [Armatimonadota bacterium]
MGQTTKWFRPKSNDVSFVLDQQAWVLLITDITLVLLGVLVLVVSNAARMIPLSFDTVVFVIIVVMGALLSLLMLRKGFYSIAAHLTLMVTSAGLWGLNIRNADQPGLRTDPVYLVGFVAIPALLVDGVWPIIYGLGSLAVIGYVANVQAHSYYIPRDEAITFFVDFATATIFVMIFTYAISHIYRHALSRVERLLEEQRQFSTKLLDMTERLELSEAQRRQFYRDTIYCVTSGELSIVDEPSIARFISKAELAIDVPDAESASNARHRLTEYCRQVGLTGESLEKFEGAIGEALANVVKHAGGGKAYAGHDENSVWVAVEDHGPGIESLLIPRAILLRGYSTKPSLGIGYSVILAACDQVLLKTDPTGTTVVMIKNMRTTEPQISLEQLPDTWESVPTER